MLSGSHVKDSTPGGLIVRRKWLIESESPNLKKEKLESLQNWKHHSIHPTCILS